MSDAKSIASHLTAEAPATLDTTIRHHLGKQLQSRYALVLDSGYDAMSSQETSGTVPTLDALIRERLGQQLRVIFEPVSDQIINPRLTDILQKFNSIV